MCKFGDRFAWRFVCVAFCLLTASSIPALAQNSGASTDNKAASQSGDRASALETKLIDLQVRLATAYSLSTSAGKSPKISALEQEIAGLASELGQLSANQSPIQPAATQGRSFARGAMVPAAEPSAGGWAGTTTVSPNSPVVTQQSPSISGTGEILPGSVFGDQQSQRGGGVRADNSGGWPQSNQAGSNAAAPAVPSYRQLPPGGYGVSPPPTSSADNSIAALAPQAGSMPQPAPQLDSAETAYQRAYGLLLAQDHGAAEVAFKEFLQRYPKSSLAGNAQYWLGETYYARGAYREAAVAFLKGFETYGRGNKGPDSLLKLALSLGKLDQSDAACSSLREFGAQYPAAPAALHARAKQEAGRLRCPS